MSTELRFSGRRGEDGTEVLAVTGEIDMSNSDAFAAAIEHALPGHGRLLVDLTAVEYLDSAGLTAMFVHADQIEIVVTPLLAPTLTISGLADVTTMHQVAG